MRASPSRTRLSWIANGMGSRGAISPAAPPDSSVALGREAARGHRVAHAQDRAHARLQRARGDGVGRGRGKLLERALGEAQARRAAAQRAAHERRAGHDEASAEAPVGAECIDGERGARDDHELVARARGMGGHEGGPAVGAELRGIAVAVHDAQLLGARRDHRERYAVATRRPRRGRAPRPRRPRCTRPRGRCARSEAQPSPTRADSAVGIAARGRPRAAVVHAPFDARVARVDREDDRFLHRARSEISAEARVSVRPSGVATTRAPSGATSRTSASNGASRGGATRTARPW